MRPPSRPSGRITELQPDLAGATRAGHGPPRAGRSSRRDRELPAGPALGPDALAWSNLGAALYTEGRLDEAVQAFGEAVKLEPAAPANHRNLGDAWQRPRTARGGAPGLVGGRAAVPRRRCGWTPARPRRSASWRCTKRSSATTPAPRLARARPSTLAPGDADVHYRASVVHALGGRGRRGGRGPGASPPTAATAAPSPSTTTTSPPCAANPTPVTGRTTHATKGTRRSADPPPGPLRFRADGGRRHPPRTPSPSRSTTTPVSSRAAPRRRCSR